MFHVVSKMRDDEIVSRRALLLSSKAFTVIWVLKSLFCCPAKAKLPKETVYGFSSVFE